MSYDLTNDADGSPSANFPGISANHLRFVTRWGLIALAALFLFLILWWAMGVYTDWLWFSHLEFQALFTKVLLYRVLLFIGGTAIGAVVLALNFYLTTRFARGQSVLPLPPDSMRLLVATIAAGVIATLLIASPVLGSMVSGRWQTFLLFMNRIPFGISDPEFGLDASFYIVTLDLLNFVHGWLLGLVITTIIASLALYLAIFGLRGINLVITPRMLKHLAVLGAFLMLIIASGHVLDIYELVLSGQGIVQGATYTDVNARIPVLWFLTSIAGLAAIGFLASIYHGGLRIIIGSFSLWVILMLVAGLVFPALFQRFQVAPNEFAREETFIRRNIEATRAAYQLDRVRESSYSAEGVLNPRTVQENQTTLENIRLWDLQPLKDAYNQLQFNQLYYNFLNTDSDRYWVDGQLRQVLVAARELDSENLPTDAQNWVNQRLQYTHGYGITMSPATGFTPGEGRPEFFLRDIPIQGKLEVSRPELYYGESPIDYSIVHTRLREVDPNPEFQRYDGNGGVFLSSTVRRMAYAWQFGDVNLLLSDQITPQSRIQYRRQIRERVGTIAPFLKLDEDPYPVLDDNGKLWWILDAYTTANRYPYSASSADGFNYIRNSVKVTVDAYNGTVNFYVIDPEDPLLQMYQKAFPALFQDIDQMPPVLRDHIRYPVGLFSVQARMYLRYHVTNPQVFFNQADQWALPLETRIGKTGVQVTPSYLVMRLPDEEKEEFVLLLPFTPAGEKKNLVAWLAARNDWPHYGELLSFQMPHDRQIDGPSQVEARIENDQSVSQQFTLWDGAGSQIIRGQLLVIPIADTIIYVEPLYLQSEVLAFPELKKVILADDRNLVMADTIDQGLSLLVSGGSTTPVAASPSAGALPEELADLERIEEAVNELQGSLKELRESLESLRETLEGGQP
jgi:uncharacterized membrane protein (UPF0182 family)